MFIVDVDKMVDFFCQVNKLKQKCDAQEEQLQKAERRAENSASIAAEESSRRNGILEFIRFLDNEVNY